MCSGSASHDALTFQVNSLEELVFLTGYDVAVCVGQAEDPGSSLTEDQRSLRIHQALETLCQVIAQAGSSAIRRIMSVPYCLDTLCILIRQHWIHLPSGRSCMTAWHVYFNHCDLFNRSGKMFLAVM